MSACIGVRPSKRSESTNTPRHSNSVANSTSTETELNGTWNEVSGKNVQLYQVFKVMWLVVGGRVVVCDQLEKHEIVGWCNVNIRWLINKGNVKWIQFKKKIINCKKNSFEKNCRINHKRKSVMVNKKLKKIFVCKRI